MFLEKTSNEAKRTGWIEVICGSMFSGKTEELIRRLNRAKIAKQRVEIFKPEVDTRYGDEEVVSHDENSIKCTPVQTASQILLYDIEADVVAIDEAQFFDMELIHVCNELANRGYRVVAAGLDMDFRGVPFGPMPGLMASAEYVTKVHAICIQCGSLAQYSHRFIKDESIVVLGEKESYQPLCRSCYTEKQKA
ncbi:MAG: thymidine kinase [Bacteroidetes bacterium]|nr:thymidine kinase [Bacteroidota bacterium]